MFKLSKELILASASPRRQKLLESLGVTFSTQPTHVAESFPPDLPVVEVAKFLAELKANAVQKLGENQLVLAADTTVILGQVLLGKPENLDEAEEMLTKLSGNVHQVCTGFCLRDSTGSNSYSEVTSVTFRKLTNAEIKYYVENFCPLDKAGGYGIQEWIGLVGIERIDGCYYNVMGLPTRALWQALTDRYAV